MADYFQRQSPWGAVASNTGSNIAQALASLPIIRAQSRESKARVGLYGAQTGYYQTKAAVEQAKEFRLSQNVQAAAPFIGKAMRGEKLMPEESTTLGNILAESLSIDPEGTSKAVANFGTMLQGPTGMQGVAGVKPIILNPQEEAFGVGGERIASNERQKTVGGDDSAYTAGVANLLRSGVDQMEFTADEGLRRFQGAVRPGRSASPGEDNGMGSRAFGESGVPLKPPEEGAPSGANSRVTSKGNVVTVVQEPKAPYTDGLLRGAMQGLQNAYQKGATVVDKYKQGVQGAWEVGQQFGPAMKEHLLGGNEAPEVDTAPLPVGKFDREAGGRIAEGLVNAPNVPFSPESKLRTQESQQAYNLLQQLRSTYQGKYGKPFPNYSDAAILRWAVSERMVDPSVVDKTLELTR